MTEPHQQRVAEELDDLRGKINRLTAFLDSAMYQGLPTEERDRLKAQLAFMNGYAGVLDQRIAAFNDA